MPIYVGYTSAKKMKANPMIGMLLGGILIHPTFVSMIGGENPFSIFGIQVTPTNYASTIIPIILSVYVLTWVEKLLKKIIPDMIKTVFTPFLSILIMLPIMFGVCGAIGGWIGTALCNDLLALGNIPILDY